MNEKKIEKMMPTAYKVLSDTGIAKDNAITKTYRGQISTFGAAITSGSLLAAIAFFSDKGDSSVDRTKLITAIWKVLIAEKLVSGNYNDLFDYVAQHNTTETKNNVLHAAIALKLAMNLYKLV